LGVLLIALAPRLAGAATVDLWSATVSVTDQGDAERERGFQAGLGQIVVRLTGQRSVLTDPGVAALVARAPQLVAGYDYKQSPIPGSASGAPPNFLLQVSFAPAAVDAAVRQLHLPLWPAQRPQLLLVAGGSEAEGAAILEVARQVLAERGVPVLEPLGDLQDRQILGGARAGFATDRIAALARHYETNRWLELEPEGAPGGRWRLGDGGTLLSGTATGDSLAHWVENAVGDAVDRLAARLAYLPGTGSADLSLVVEGLASYRAYRGVLETLGAMEFVRKVEVTWLHGDQVGLELRLDGDPGLLWAALDSNPRFSAVAPAGQLAAAPPPIDSPTPVSEQPPATAAAAPPPARHYRWREP
jgi:hypothetical protein